MLPSAPPPPMRRPGLARAGVTPHRDAIRDALREWMRATNTSVREPPDGWSWDHAIPYRLSVEAGADFDVVDPVGFV